MSQQQQQTNTTERLTFEKVERFIRYIDRDDVLQLILSINEKQRPAEAARLYNEEHPTDTITTKQARYIGDHYYLENGKICALTPEIAARLN